MMVAITIMTMMFQARQVADDQKVAHLGKLRGLGVDVTQVLLAQAAKPKEVVQVVSTKDSANVHLHYN